MRPRRAVLALALAILSPLALGQPVQDPFQGIAPPAPPPLPAPAPTPAPTPAPAPQPQVGPATPPPVSDGTVGGPRMMSPPAPTPA
ncbi:MAG TPA: hypothetical protein VD970_01195, partial [Acetobacteraceae bacterium]|nr:hypothetical protein [Acetobacteraceae bacterium]